MKDDGRRLSISIRVNGFDIIDNVTGKHIIKTNGQFVSFDLEKEFVLQHIDNLTEAIATYKDIRTIHNNKFPKIREDVIIIREDSHYTWSVWVQGYSAVIGDYAFKRHFKFDKNALMSAINRVAAEVSTYGINLNPKRDIVRRIPDAGILVWVYEGHSVVCFEKNICGNIMTDCMIDGLYYKIVAVSSSRETGTTSLFTLELDILLTVPLDDSVMSYYPADEDAFNDEE